MGSQEEKIIAIRVKLLQDKDNLATLKKDFTKINKISKGKEFSKAPLVQGMKPSSKDMKAMSTLSPQLFKIAKAEQTAAKTTNKLKTAMNGLPFQGWAMSMMFAGMAMKRMFDTILKSGVGTFNEIMASQEGATTSTSKLGGMWKYLQFTIGDAINQFLEPLIGTIWDIIYPIGEWINENQKLVAAFLIIGAVVGTVLMVFGMAVLAIAGFITAFGILGITVMGVVYTLAIIAAAIVTFIILWQTNLGGFKDFIMNSFGILLAGIKRSMGYMAEVFKNVWGFITSLLKGEWGDALGYLWKAFKYFATAMINALVTFGSMTLNGLIWTFNAIAQLFWNIVVKGILYAVSWIVKAIDAIFDTDWSKNIADFAKGSKVFQMEFIDSSATDKIMDGVDNFMGTGKNEVPTNEETEEPEEEKAKVVYNIENVNVESNNMDEIMEEVKRNAGAE
jgi:hypothetical protein